ncbi:MAG: hypothetical protein U9N85_13890 [Bacteroidota bacterium]|nr:hypothetical protein [Bacteroidota bacterium]
MLHYIFTLGFLLVHTLLLAQSDTLKLEFTASDFKFDNGLFLNFNMVKKNKPISKVQIKTSINYSDYDFFTQLTEQKEITFYDKLGDSQSVRSKHIWGYCNNGVLFIRFNNEFNRIPLLGNISHFTANYTYTERNMSNYYSNRYNYYDNHQTRTELRQYIFDMETGQIYDFNYQSMLSVLSYDRELLEEYAALSKRKQKKLKFLYLRKFNQNNPIRIYK